MSSDPSLDDGLLRIRDNIVAFVESTLADDKPCYLSALGIRLGTDIRELRRIAQIGLADFIKQTLFDRYELAHAANDKSTILVQRKSSDAEGDLLPLPNLNYPKKERFIHQLWTAFAVPWSGDDRYFSLKRHVWRNHPEGDEGGWLPISSEYVRSDDGDYNEDEIAANLRRWCSDNNINVEDFTIRAPPPKPAARSAAREQTALDWLISNLDKRRLETIQLPLDVVHILSSKTVGRG